MQKPSFLILSFVFSGLQYGDSADFVFSVSPGILLIMYINHAEQPKMLCKSLVLLFVYCHIQDGVGGMSHPRQRSGTLKTGERQDCFIELKAI